MLLGDRLGLPIPRLALHRVQVVALGGLSEVGKNTAGAYLAARHARCGIADVYALDEVAIAEILVLGLEMYVRRNTFSGTCRLRACTGPVTAKLLGDRLTVVYLDASLGMREARSVTGPADVHERDGVKRSRGAERIRELADSLIDNNGPRLALYRALDKIATSHRWPRAAPQRVAVSGLRLPSRLAAYLDALLARMTDPAAPLVSLLAVTGSGRCHSPSSDERPARGRVPGQAGRTIAPRMDLAWLVRHRAGALPRSHPGWLHIGRSICDGA